MLPALYHARGFVKGICEISLIGWHHPWASVTWSSWDPPLLSLFFFSLSSISFLSSITWAFQCSSVFSCYRLSLCSSPNLSYFSFLSPHFSSATFFSLNLLFFFMVSHIHFFISSSLTLLSFLSCTFHTCTYPFSFVFPWSYRKTWPFIFNSLSFFFVQFPFIPCLFISFPLLYCTLLPSSFFSSASLKSS